MKLPPPPPVGWAARSNGVAPILADFEAPAIKHFRACGLREVLPPAQGGGGGDAQRPRGTTWHWHTQPPRQPLSLKNASDCQGPTGETGYLV